MNRTRHRVIYADTDAGQVVYYANYFRFFETGRREIFRQLGIDFKKLMDAGIIAPVVESHCNYFAPAVYDDLLGIETYITELKDKTIRFEYVIRNESGKMIVSGYTVNVFADSGLMKSISIPKEVKSAVKVDEKPNTAR
ncbi:acyl-CoA thioesterase [Candidatus Woesearchaeota archaeon]|nr:acyl-CoA thioesterase [Candidatus Woesearchaeota archaeon]